MADYKSIIEAVKLAAKEENLEEYELYLTSSESIGCETFRDELSDFSSSNSTAIYFRCIKNGKLGYATTQKTDAEEIELLVKRGAENALINEKSERAIIYGGGEYKDLPKNEFTLPSASELAKTAMDLRNALYAEDENIADGSAGGTGAYVGATMLCNSKGLILENKGGNSSAYMYAVVNNPETNTPECAFKSVYNCLDNIDMKGLSEYVVKKAKSKFGAGLVKTGKYNIIFSRECMTQILSTYRSVFYADSAQKGFSKLNKDLVGTLIATPSLSLIDTPFYQSNPMKTAFDGEGYPTSEKYVIKDGVLNTMLYNLTTAEKDGVESTGNASRGGSGIGTRVYSFYISPGKMNDEELIKYAENGIFITDMKGFHAGADTVSGDFSIESEGFMIENGTLAKPVRSFTVAGNFFDLLRNVKEISSELEMKAPGYTQIASPAILVENMAVAGE